MSDNKLRGYAQTFRDKIISYCVFIREPERVRGAVRIARQPSNALLGVKRAESHGFKSHRTRHPQGTFILQTLLSLFLFCSHVIGSSLFFYRKRRQELTF